MGSILYTGAAGVSSELSIMSSYSDIRGLGNGGNGTARRRPPGRGIAIGAITPPRRPPLRRAGNPAHAWPMAICGIDEAGRGPLAGPVVAAAVILPRRGRPKGLDDSKQLTPEAREELAAAIRRVGVFAI